MANTDAELMAFVEAEMAKNPDIATKELFEKAKEEMEAAGELTIRQFHARYPLQVKRRQSLAAGGAKSGGGRRSKKPRSKGIGRGRGRRRSTAAKASGNRDEVRTVLLKFASDLSAAEERKDLVGVLAQMDKYVDDVLKAAAT